MRLLLCVAFCASLFLLSGCGGESVKTDTKTVNIPKSNKMEDTHTNVGKVRVD